MFVRYMRPRNVNEYIDRLLNACKKFMLKDMDMRIPGWHKYMHGKFAKLLESVICFHNYMYDYATEEEKRMLPAWNWGHEKNPGMFYIWIQCFHPHEQAIVQKITFPVFKAMTKPETFVSAMKEFNKTNATVSRELEAATSAMTPVTPMSQVHRSIDDRSTQARFNSGRSENAFTPEAPPRTPFTSRFASRPGAPATAPAAAPAVRRHVDMNVFEEEAPAPVLRVPTVIQPPLVDDMGSGSDEDAVERFFRMEQYDRNDERAQLSYAASTRSVPSRSSNNAPYSRATPNAPAVITDAEKKLRPCFSKMFKQICDDRLCKYSHDEVVLKAGIAEAMIKLQNNPYCPAEFKFRPLHVAPAALHLAEEVPSFSQIPGSVPHQVYYPPFARNGDNEMDGVFRDTDSG
jgi:hypothetical protein